MNEAAEQGSGVSNAASSTGTTICEVFRSPRREGLYLYVKREDGLSKVPEALLNRFGQPESALIFRLSADRRLAQANAADVLDALVEPGYYLQMPPADDTPDSDSSSDAANDSREDADLRC